MRINRSFTVYINIWIYTKWRFTKYIYINRAIISKIYRKLKRKQILITSPFINLLLWRKVSKLWWNIFAVKDEYCIRDTSSGARQVPVRCPSGARQVPVFCYYSRVFLLHPCCSHARCILCGIHTPCMGAPFPATNARCSPPYSWLLERVRSTLSPP